MMNLWHVMGHTPSFISCKQTGIRMRRFRVRITFRNRAGALASSVWDHWRFFPRLLGLIWELNRRDVLLLASFALGGGLLPILALNITLQLVDRSVAVIGGHAPFAAVVWWLVGFFFIGLLENLFAIAHE